MIKPMQRCSYRSRSSMLWVLGLIIMLALTGLAQGQDVVEANDPAEGGGEVTAGFTESLNKAYVHLRSLDRYFAQGILTTHVNTGDGMQEQHYKFSLAKNGITHFSISVYEEDGQQVVMRLLSAGRQKSAKLYLPREINAMMMMARLQDQPEGIAVSAVLMLYDFLEYSRPEQWLKMLSKGELSGPEVVGDQFVSCLELTFNNYFSLRNLNVQMPLYGAEGVTPKIAGLRIDLSAALRELPTVALMDASSSVTVDLRLDPWEEGTPPPSQEFAIPVPRTQFQDMGVAEIFEFANADKSTTSLPRLESIPRTPAAASAMVSKFKSAPRSEQRRMVNEARKSPAAQSLRSRAKQMGLTEQDIRRIKSLMGP
jgi:hypothetical protein